MRLWRPRPPREAAMVSFPPVAGWGRQDELALSKLSALDILRDGNGAQSHENGRYRASREDLALPILRPGGHFEWNGALLGRFTETSRRKQYQRHGYLPLATPIPKRTTHPFLTFGSTVTLTGVARGSFVSRYHSLFSSDTTPRDGTGTISFEVY